LRRYIALPPPNRFCSKERKDYQPVIHPKRGGAISGYHPVLEMAVCQKAINELGVAAPSEP
jgi:hypothetical protein